VIRAIGSWGLLVIAVAFVIVMGFRDLTSVSGPDYCAMANMRQCKVGDRGEWVMVTSPDGAQHMVYLKNGRVIQVQ
jgi:hypothetical protein